MSGYLILGLLLGVAILGVIAYTAWEEYRMNGDDPYE